MSIIIKGLSVNDGDIIIIISKAEMEREKIESSFFEHLKDYAVEIRNLQKDTSFCVHTKTYKI